MLFKGFHSTVDVNSLSLTGSRVLIPKFDFDIVIEECLNLVKPFVATLGLNELAIV